MVLIIVGSRNEKQFFVPMIIFADLIYSCFCKLCIAELTRVDVKLRKLAALRFSRNCVCLRVNLLVVAIELRVRQAWRDFFDALSELNNLNLQ